MTGGTEKAGNINRILATVAGKYGFGMGLIPVVRFYTVTST
jgi:isopentenyl diphosphate isomerase/L-lactate dehydrogenase-like FMN-dependent dehydrogenase